MALKMVPSGDGFTPDQCSIWWDRHQIILNAIVHITTTRVTTIPFNGGCILPIYWWVYSSHILVGVFLHTLVGGCLVHFIGLVTLSIPYITRMRQH